MEEAAGLEAKRMENEIIASRTQLPWKKMGNRRYWEVGRLLASFYSFLQRFIGRPQKNKNPFPAATEQGRGKKRRKQKRGSNFYFCPQDTPRSSKLQHRMP